MNNPKNPERRPHGELVTCQGASGNYRAYLPGPLPPPINWTPGLLSQLSRADQAVGRLAGETRRGSHIDSLAGLFLRKEAVYSSYIESTRTSLEELFITEAGVRVLKAPSDLTEVQNCVKSLEYALSHLEQLSLSQSLVQESHGCLMRGIRNNATMPGIYRDHQNWIGAPGSRIQDATYVPPPADKVAECMSMCLESTNNPGTAKTL